MALAAVSAAVEHPSRALPEGVTSLDRCAPDGERLNYGVEFAYCLRQVRLIGLALINVQFRPDVFLDEGAQAATAIRQLDRAADLRLQVVQGRRSAQECATSCSSSRNCANSWVRSATPWRAWNQPVRLAWSSTSPVSQFASQPLTSSGHW